MFGGNAGSEILDIEFDSEFDAAFGGAAVLHGVVDEVRENLVDGFAIGVHGGQRLHGSVSCLYDLQVDFLSAGDLAETFFGVVQELDGRDGLGVETGLAGFDAGQSEQVFGEARHAGGVLADDFEKLAAGIVIFGAEVEQGFGVSLNRGLGRAEFVGNVGDEIAAGFFDALGFGQIAEHGDGAAIGQGCGGNVVGAAGNDRRGAGGLDLLGGGGGFDGGEEIGIADGFLDRSVEAGVLRD